MKKYIDIRKQYAKNTEQIKQLEKIIENTKIYSSRDDIKLGTRPVKDTEAEQIVIDAGKKKYLLEIEQKILYDNTRRAWIAENLPILREVLEQYAGKTYGKKTKAKINDELKARANFHAYIIQDKYSCEISFCPLDKNGYNDYFFGYNNLTISNWGTDGRILTGEQENKIDPDALQYFRLYNCAEYVEQPRKHAAQIAREWEKVKEQREKLEKTFEAFSALLPSGIEDISFYSNNVNRNYLF